jgi:hypothetical protein
MITGRGSKVNTIAFICLLLIGTAGSTQSRPDEEVIYEGPRLPLYPVIVDFKPPIGSPHTADDGIEYVVGVTSTGAYTVFEVTVTNGEELNYKKNVWYARGRQLDVDSADFPALAGTGLHSEDELQRVKTITGRSVDEITRIGRPEQYSGVGFLADDEDIVSVLAGDNRLVRNLGLTHPDLARPLFHVFNVIQAVMSQSGYRKRGDAQAILYNDRTINLRFWGAKGWQESIFNDEILGYWEIEMWRELDDAERAFLSEHYANLSEQERSQMIRQLSYIHTGEMAAFYAMRYGFYEGHTGYRADPIAIAFIFGLRTVEQLDAAFSSDLPSALSRHHTSDMMRENIPADSR